MSTLVLGEEQATTRSSQNSKSETMICTNGMCKLVQKKENGDTHPIGIVYYLDGAGGGSLLTNWAPGVSKGLKEADFQGNFREFIWQTGLGVLADQTFGLSYKQEKGKALAKKIIADKKEHPDWPIALIGLSAGTSVAICTLEALPENCTVNQVILLGSSMDAGYDLRKALKHLDGTLLVYTSMNDEVLKLLVPMAGTADRKYVGDSVAGLRGFIQPNNQEETRGLYEKIKIIPWRTEFSRYDNHGGHTDTTNSRFVQKFLAPSIISLTKPDTSPKPDNTTILLAGAE
jgi:hypothetical protein